MVHELPDAGRFFREARAALRPGAELLMAEPFLHVGESDFAASLSAAPAAGFSLVERPSIRLTRAAVLSKRGSIAPPNPRESA